MAKIRYLIDREGLITLQKMYNCFAFDKNKGQFVVDLGRDFLPLQKSRYRKRVFSLYQKLYTVKNVNKFQSIIFQSNHLLSFLLQSYGSFTAIDNFNKVDSFDFMALMEMADEIENS